MRYYDCSGNNYIEQNIIIFIHGTLGLYKKIGLKNIKNSLMNLSRKKDKNNSDNILNFIEKENCEFYRDIISKNEKLEFLDLNQNNLFSSGNFLLYYFDKIFNQTFEDLDKEYYSFGWSGELLNEKRIQYGKILYEDLCKLIKEKNKQGIKPFITIIGNSHGGNIALNISEWINKELKIPIKYLFLIGTPILKSSNEYICTKLKNKDNNFLFENVFNIYSEGDFIQIGDFISNNDENKKFSQRTFSVDRKNIFNISLLYTKKPFNKKLIQDIKKNRSVIKALFENFKDTLYFPHHIELIGYLYNKNRGCIPFSVLSTLVLKSFINDSDNFWIQNKNDNKNYFKIILDKNNNSINILNLSNDKLINLPIENDFFKNYNNDALKIYEENYKNKLEKYSIFDIKYYF